MFYSNRQVANLVNIVYGSENNSQFNIPDKEVMVQLLNDRKPIKLFYFVREIDNTPAEPEVAPDFLAPFTQSPGMAYQSFKMTIRQLYFYPLGELIWSDDKSLDLVTQCGNIVDQSAVSMCVFEKFVSFLNQHFMGIDENNRKENDKETIELFVERLNRQ